MKQLNKGKTKQFNYLHTNRKRESNGKFVSGLSETILQYISTSSIIFQLNKAYNRKNQKTGFKVSLVSIVMNKTKISLYPRKYLVQKNNY